MPRVKASTSPADWSRERERIVADLVATPSGAWREAMNAVEDFSAKRMNSDQAFAFNARITESCLRAIHWCHYVAESKTWELVDPHAADRAADLEFAAAAKGNDRNKGVQGAKIPAAKAARALARFMRTHGALASYGVRSATRKTGIQIADALPLDKGLRECVLRDDGPMRGPLVPLEGGAVKIEEAWKGLGIARAGRSSSRSFDRTFAEFLDALAEEFTRGSPARGPGALSYRQYGNLMFRPGHLLTAKSLPKPPTLHAIELATLFHLAREGEPFRQGEQFPRGQIAIELPRDLEVCDELVAPLVLAVFPGAEKRAGPGKKGTAGRPPIDADSLQKASAKLMEHYPDARLLGWPDPATTHRR